MLSVATVMQCETLGLPKQTCRLKKYCIQATPRYSAVILEAQSRFSGHGLVEEMAKNCNIIPMKCCVQTIP